MYVRVAKRVRARDQISMNRNMVGIPYLGARNPHCPEYPLIYEILVGIPSSGDSVQWGFRPVGIPGGNPIRHFVFGSLFAGHLNFYFH